MPILHGFTAECLLYLQSSGAEPSGVWPFSSRLVLAGSVTRLRRTPVPLPALTETPRVRANALTAVS